jgi:hypothetical protein
MLSKFFDEPVIKEFVFGIEVIGIGPTSIVSLGIYLWNTTAIKSERRLRTHIYTTKKIDIRTTCILQWGIYRAPIENTI